jgi:hypothetical protein
MDGGQEGEEHAVALASAEGNGPRGQRHKEPVSILYAARFETMQEQQAAGALAFE